MRQFSTSDKLQYSAWTLTVRALFVVAVFVVALLPGISVAGGLVIVSVGLALFALFSIWVPVPRTSGGRPRPPTQSSGDRFPRRPRPFGPSLGAERPLPSD